MIVEVGPQLRDILVGVSIHGNIFGHVGDGVGHLGVGYLGVGHLGVGHLDVGHLGVGHLVEAGEGGDRVP